MCDRTSTLPAGAPNGTFWGAGAAGALNGVKVGGGAAIGTAGAWTGTGAGAGCNVKKTS